ncbi:MAG: [ribosomal protein S5]-alanine N-acetyltransferase [Pseudonocardiales bacterium]|nr:[ribosomal protein S5]-alanine N-acetyltransferase [Pseudonocardiales bacterium]MDT7590892.1 [ribosomal protein S5]-alanine N-acetyltransferase [Pseudonocardiales bacterium]MDT7605969.1 [ribosomal protein S5]-alanine N-acetyltransferase [Pseudonocardiales bacterium]MDT7639434.1 [ribosomal protein S5]-alanine N-acetyltransferase [Pseudonocardiales bacterium]MDT7657382.1 [ribosomal protein S5]-alanine N-acetyltransferase [Pseudonocardiales bacterium]
MAHSAESGRLGRHPGWPATLGQLRVPGGLVGVRPVRLRDGGAWAAIRSRDERHLAPWEPDMPGLWTQRNTPAEWPARWSALRSIGRRGLGLPFAITVDGEFAGQVMVGNVVRDPLWSAYIGYWVGSHAVLGGVTTAACALVLDHCFGHVGLHRIEATVRPENTASRRVLEKLGFREEGLFRRYLNVDGAWRDHLCYALTLEDLEVGLVERLVRKGQAARP